MWLRQLQRFFGLATKEQLLVLRLVVNVNLSFRPVCVGTGDFYFIREVEWIFLAAAYMKTSNYQVFSHSLIVHM